MVSSACCNTSTTCSSADLFAATIRVLAAAQCCFTDEFTSDVVDKPFFDFIIVGAGSAGSVVANRLSEIGKWKILLLEAGTEPPPQAFVPALANTLRKTQYDWNYTTINNGRTSQALRNGEVDWTRGRLLGGSSELNGMFYVKGNKEDYKSWYVKGNPSWNPDNVFRFERKAESLQDEELKNNPFVSRNYGKRGPQVVTRFNSTRTELHELILESWSSLDIKKVIDINSVEYTSPGICSVAVSTAASGIRFGTYRSYILPARGRSNLKIVTEALVTKVLINDNKTAYGVEANVKGQIKEFYAKNEVILCAGAINSPQLLMLSGVGPRQHLESKNIKVKVNSPSVGKFLQDHLRIIVPIYGDKSKFDSRDEKNCAIEEYCCNRTGYLAQVGLDSLYSFYSYHQYLKYPELQNHVLITFENATTFARNAGYKEEVINSLFQYFPDKTLYLFFVVLLHPYSTGSISLNTSSPYDKPIINANYFGDRRDLVLTARGINILTEIVNTKFFRSINAYIPRIKWPECNRYRFNTTRYWMCFAKNTVTTLYHPSSTCRMGPNPLDSVVDNFLRVHGVRNLRVVDASIMPSLTSGNINGPTIMIGEMGASMIKKDYNKE
ncbi:uncharacterized GMC-type oxidoreductase Mb1310-like [Aricia agestis]|uniref:uncharacterized GMC-type oxidoreductase Mb1310-like n=1 Tax=Aricia agestis TaxID=91739 RepID=UPI001C201626|nr:uncharacterized GMC-type oxidoreductase Mb1310-like [Aricia agestis]